MLNTVLGTFSSGVAVSTSSYESIATATGSGNFSFTSIPSTYKHLQLRFSFTTTNVGGGPGVTFNNDGGTNYAYHQLKGNGASATANGVSSDSFFGFFYGNGFVATYPNVGIMDILDYSSTTKNKTVRMFSGANDNSASNTTSMVYLESAVWLSTAAINRIDSLFMSGNSNVSIALYGIKG